MSNEQDSTALLSATLTRGDGTLIALQRGENTIGRNELLDNGADRQPEILVLADHQLKAASVSRKQLLLQFSDAALLATRIGGGVSRIRRAGAASTEEMRKNEAVTLSDGDIIYVHSADNGGRLAFPMTAALERPPAPAPAPEPPPPAAAPAPAARPVSPPPAAPAPPPAPPPPAVPLPTAVLPQATLPSTVATPAASSSSSAAADKRPRAKMEAGADPNLPPAKKQTASSSAPPEDAAETLRFRALLVPWKPADSRSERQAALTLTLDDEGRLGARVCDGVELRGTPQPLEPKKQHPWGITGLPSGPLHASLAPHPWDLEKLRLTLRVGTESGSGGPSTSAAPLNIDLVKMRGREAGGKDGGIGGAMLQALLARIAALRADVAKRTAANAALEQQVAQREAELEDSAAKTRSNAAAELASVLPLLLAKQEKLEGLEREAVDKGVVLEEEGGEEEHED